MIEVIPFPARLSPSFVADLKRAAEDPKVEGIILEFSDANVTTEDELHLLLRGDDVIHPLRDTLRSLETQSKPLVALIHQSLSGLAFEVCLACHTRIVSNPDVAFHWGWFDLGILPALGTGRRLSHIAGLEKTVQVLLFGARLSRQRSLLKMPKATIEKSLKIGSKSIRSRSSHGMRPILPVRRSPARPSLIVRSCNALISS